MYVYICIGSNFRETGIKTGSSINQLDYTSDEVMIRGGH